MHFNNTSTEIYIALVTLERRMAYVPLVVDFYWFMKTITVIFTVNESVSRYFMIVTHTQIHTPI